jgi:hypothetical protein
MSLIDFNTNSNYFGKDGLKFWIGQVTTDKTWIESSECFGYRAKVRIQGWHPPTAEVSDSDLPWAHVPVPLAFGSGNGLAGISLNLQGGETCFGFFLDPPHCQQPVILSSLFTNSGTEKAYTESGPTPIQVIPYSEVNQKNTSEFKLFGYDPKIELHAGNSPQGGVKPANFGLTKGNLDPNGNSNKQLYYDNYKYVVSVAEKCKSGKGITGEITKIFRTFINVTNGLKQVKSGYLDPILNEIVKIDQLILEAANAIAGLFAQILRTARKWLIKEIYSLVTNIPAINNLLKDIAVGKAVDAIYCVIEKIIKGLVNLVAKYLTSLIGKLTSIPICAAEQFVGGILSDLSDTIQTQLGPALNEIQKLVGPINTFFSYVQRALNYAQQAVNFLSCEGNDCQEKGYDWSVNFGPVPKNAQDFQRVINVSSSISNLQGDASRNIDNWFGNPNSPGISELDGCNPFTINCGAPSITIFGGGGSGAIANAVINDLGQIVGVNMSSLGFGYTSEPFVSFIDECDNGKGATGTAIINNGEVVNIVITNPGNGYLQPQTGTSDDTGVDVAGKLDGIQIINTGYAYSSNDIITSECGTIQPELDDEGRIIGGTVLSAELGCTSIPDLTINTVTGYGAIIRPIIKYTKRSEISTFVPQNKLIRIVDCISSY